MITESYVTTFAARLANIKNPKGINGQLNSLTIILVNGDRIVCETEKDSKELNTAPQVRDGGVLVVTGSYTDGSTKDEKNEYQTYTATEHHIALSQIERFELNYTKTIVKPRDPEEKPQPEGAVTE